MKQVAHIKHKSLAAIASAATAIGSILLLPIAAQHHLAALLLAPVWAWLPLSLQHLRRARTHRKTLLAAVDLMQADRRLDQFRVARRDVLTGLSNRQAFLETLSKQFCKGTRFAVAVVNLDMFDKTNANLGEASGDEVLSAVAACLQSNVECHHAARLDGDSFALLLHRKEELDRLPDVAACLLRKLRGPHAAAGQAIDIGASIGIALSGHHGETGETLLRAADMSMRAAKRRGGGQVHICGEDIAADILARQDLRREMRRALEIGQIIPYYQPIVSLPSGEVVQFEVLARWQHPEFGLLLPDDFIPVAESLGLSGQVSMALLRQVGADTDDWPAWCRFAINVSAGQVRELIGLLNAQPGAWQRRLDLSRLDVEISEQAIMQDRGLARELIDTLHEHGARAVLDDFGSGSSNFFHLRDMPFDSIKIGKSFVQTINEDKRAEACVMAMLWLGIGLGIDIVADGVETAEIGARLAELGCHFAQGFFYARPAPADDVRALLGLDAGTLEAA